MKSITKFARFAEKAANFLVKTTTIEEPEGRKFLVIICGLMLGYIIGQLGLAILEGAPLNLGMDPNWIPAAVAFLCVFLFVFVVYIDKDEKKTATASAILAS